MDTISISKPIKKQENLSTFPVGKVKGYIVKDQDVSFKQTKALNINQQQSLFTAIGLVISLLMVIVVFEWKSYEVADLVNLGTLDAEFEEILDIPVTQKEPPPPAKELIPPQILEVPDEEVIEEEI
jgi:protein TonB